MPVPRTSPPAVEPVANMAGLLKAPRQQLAESGVLAMAPGDPFMLKHHWSSWEVAGEGLDEGACWLPKLKKHTLRPGVNHTHTLRRGQTPQEGHEDGFEIERRAGWTFLEQHPLDATHRPAGVSEGPYMREVDVRHPRTGTTGVAFLEAWQVPLPTMPGDEEGQRFKFDRGAYNRWRLWLVESGQIAPPLPHVIAKITSRYEGRVPTTQAKQWPTTEMGQKQTQKAQAVADLHTEAVVPEAPEPVAPPPPKAKVKKAKATAKPEETPS